MQVMPNAGWPLETATGLRAMSAVPEDFNMLSMTDFFGSFGRTCDEMVRESPAICESDWVAFVAVPMPIGCFCPGSCGLSAAKVREICPCEKDLLSVGPFADPAAAAAQLELGTFVGGGAGGEREREREEFGA